MHASRLFLVFTLLLRVRACSFYATHNRKHATHHAAGDYGKANKAMLHMLTKMKNSPDNKIPHTYSRWYPRTARWHHLIGLRESFTPLLEAITTIDDAIQEIFTLCPLVLVDVLTGKWCNAPERIRLFKSEKPFERLIFETATKKIAGNYICRAVTEYFQ